MGRNLAIILAGALIAFAVALTGRWQVSAAPGGLYRLDRWTGAVSACDTAGVGTGVQKC